MEKLKFILFLVVVLAVVGLVLYWAVSSIQSGTEHVTNQKIEQLSEENEELKKEIERLTDELGLLQPEVADEKSAEEPVVVKKPASVTMYQHQELIDELQKLIDDNVVMKLKAQGTRVGTVQKFLNIYNNTSNKIDNDYGATTQKQIAAFQKVQDLSGDGEAGKTTFSKMINWLKEQG